jgi:hypothetical protein
VKVFSAIEHLFFLVYVFYLNEMYFLGACQSTTSPVYRRTIIKLMEIKFLRFWYRSTYFPETHRLVPKSLKLDKQRQLWLCGRLGCTHFLIIPQVERDSISIVNTTDSTLVQPLEQV